MVLKLLLLEYNRQYFEYERKPEVTSRIQTYQGWRLFEMGVHRTP